jgi:hypothetical protein
MSTAPQTPGRDPDTIRIVQLHREPEPPAAPSAPQLTYRGGPLLTGVQVVTVFWGSTWESEQTLVDQINAFYDTILQSAYMDTLAEYSVQGHTIGHGTRAGTFTITTPRPGRSVTDAAIQRFLHHNIGTVLPQPTSNTLYVLYLPSGTSVSMGGGRSCTAFCGYHDSIGSAIFYGVLPYPGCSGCLGGMQAFEALTVTSSHELAEAITDPVPGTGWYDDVNGEIGDVCAWQTETIAGYSVQKEWSNAQGQCV